MRHGAFHRRRGAVLAVAVLAAALAAAPAPSSAHRHRRLPASSESTCADWAMYGRTLGRTFAADCPDSPIHPGSVIGLAPAWFVDTPLPVTATPAVVGGVVYVGAWDGVMYALDADDGSLRWAHATPPAPGAAFGPIVSSAAVADVGFARTTRRLVVFGAGPLVVALDAADGSEVWTLDLSAGVAGTPVEVESSPVVWNDVVYVGMDTHNRPVEETGGVRGGLLALDARTGEVLWKFEPELGGPGAGCGGVWSSPTIDEQLGLVFVGTANCPRDGVEWTPHTVAVTALDAATGVPVWAFQPSGPPDDDSDFGATPNLFVDATGRRVLGAAKKDGTYYALDPATGTLLWAAHVTDPVEGVGGFIGSPAVWRGDVFGGTAIGTPPFFHAIDGTTGALRWQGGIGPTYGATAVMNGVVFNAALDDLLKAYDARTGALLWAAPLSGPGSSGPVVVGDMVFIGAGTSTSDLCAKDNGYDELCVFVFDQVLASLGGVHAFRLVTAALE